MKELVQEKLLAIELRKQGYSYKEILERVPVAKSSLSMWLKDLPLTNDEKRVLKKRSDINISRGRIKAASELRKRRLEREMKWTKDAQELFIKWAEKPHFHAGILMYWAEGAKTSTRWMLINTDDEVIKLMVSWLNKYLNIPSEDIIFRLYIHKPYADSRCEEWWQGKLNAGEDRFLKTVFKETAHVSKQKPGHKGCLRIEVKNSKRLLFMMKVLRNQVVEYYRK
jgi:hypothetical protein